MRSLCLFLLLGVAAGVPLRPTRLLCDGSAFGGKFDPSTSFALRHDRRVRFTWEPVADAVVAGTQQSGYRVRVSAYGKEVWDSGLVQSKTPEAVYTGRPLESGTLYNWEVSWADEQGTLSEPATSSFRTGLADADWSNVNWIGSNTTNLFRAEFNAPSFTSATLYICGLGYSYVTINGVNITSSHLLTAPWTQNERLVMYSTYEVSGIMNQNAVNSIGVELGYGWRDTKAFTRHEDQQGDTTERVLRAILEVTTNGNKTVLLTTTSSGWTTGAGPVVADSVYDGETYDARKEVPGWDLVGFNGGWGPAPVVTDAPRGVMVPWSAPQVAVSRVLRPINITTPKPGIQVVDFGANIAGVVRVKGINIPAGQTVTLVHAEILSHPGIPGATYEPGMIYNANLRSAKATDVFISNGSVADFFPKFTYHGFRYVQVTGMEVTADQIELHHFHSMLQPKTTVNFSSPLLNAIQKLAVGAQRSNLMSVLTDCDQRDERLGWMGDADLSSDSLALNYDTTSFFRFCADIQGAEVDSDGSLPDVSPFYRYGGRPADVSWGAAYPQIVYVNMYANNDNECVKENLDRMVQHQKNVAGQAANGLDKMHTSYGDWVPPPVKEGGGQGPKPTAPYTSAFSYIMITKIIGDMASAVGNDSIATYMSSQVTQLKQQFNTAFFKNGVYDSNMQTDNSLALALGDGMNTQAAATNLYNSIVSENHHITTGIIGFKFLFDGLEGNGHASDALAVLETTTYPSVGYMVANTLEPATENLWELMDSPFEGTGMNSRNHHMWSSYSAYLINKLLGVDLRRQVLRPAVDVDLAAASAEVQLSNGKLRFSWVKEGGVQTAKGYRGAESDEFANTAAVACGAEGIMSEVLFASYGEALGTSHDQYREGACHHPDSKRVVEAACLGKSGCKVDLGVFDDSQLPKGCTPHLRIAVRCSNERKTKVAVTVPIGTEMALDTSGLVLLDHSGTAVEVVGNLHRLPAGVSAYTLL
eukprot:TRINITY_DN42041_c0_g1_i1.p1 TRINITY_DN42041_c0_g1~~TRINITY_DN42041_c0_g1_i1.p1  ORF type:complete len:985 (+),score=274.39 TRINITY_DN42041_c0_g1_i1:1943-4897(+)